MKPREMSVEECMDLLAKSRFGRVGLSSGDQPYVVPMSYVYVDGVILLHSGLRGKKLGIVRDNPRVCFEVDSVEKGKWKSVIVFGKARLSQDMDAKQRLFDIFTKSEMGGHGGKSFSREDIEKMPMMIWEIEIEEMAGREGVW
ncbi:MAG TPA: pyridoxamine 5'-phosphate oxidase family protein [Methanotrichaceae archaeon]|nr:pyridoxamine 5'-phosphate oxidase family protein [Methanotrichaceae archaeon]